MTYSDKFLMQGLSKYYNKIIIILKDFFKNISLKVVIKIIKKQASVAHVIMFALVSTMSIRRRKELNMFEGSTCSCFYPTWKLTSHTMATKVSQITSWVFMCSLPWAQRKKWIPIGLMGCVHTNQRILIIEGWGSPNRS
jgi:hypothetical protein